MKQGYWIITEDSVKRPEYINCSECGLQFYAFNQDDESNISNYCPHCGTKMNT